MLPLVFSVKEVGLMVIEVNVIGCPQLRAKITRIPNEHNNIAFFIRGTFSLTRNGKRQNDWTATLQKDSSRIV